MGAHHLQPPGAQRDSVATVTASLHLCLAPPPNTHSHMTSCLCSQAVEITSCGNFAVIGSSCGRVDIYNLQSGLHRGCYGNDEKGASSYPWSVIGPLCVCCQ